MNTHLLSRKKSKQFSAFSMAFSNQHAFANLLQEPFHEIDALTRQIERKKEHFSSESRQVLVSELKSQLKAFASTKQWNNIELLANENTFTVTTGHQLTLFAGPLYFIYKALHVLKLTEQFNARNSTYQLVPVFWLATEDHDIEEVRSTQLFGKKMSWETTQTGAVGQMTMHDFDTVWEEFKSKFEGKETAIKQLLNIEKSGSYQEFTQQFVSALFAELGILVIQPNTNNLKKLFVPVMKRELMEGLAYSEVDKANQKIKELGFEPQAQARAINLFYLDNQSRKRIEKTENGFVAGDRSFTFDQLFEHLEDNPSSFSPNVILRPLYQETILPNLAYVGGGGEMAYWIQLKDVFDLYKVVYPLIQQRVSFHIIDKAMQKRMDKLPFDLEAYFDDAQKLKNEFLANESAEEMDFTEIISLFSSFKNKFIEKARTLEPQLTSMVEAEFARIGKQKDALEQRLVKTIKQRNESSLIAIDFLCERFTPEKTLQERYFHWLNFVPSGDFPGLFSVLLKNLDPFQQDLIVLEFSE